MIYDVDITERVIGQPSRPSVIQHNIAVDELRPHFDEEWAGYTISVVFSKQAQGSLAELKFSMKAQDGEPTVIPWELMEDTRPISVTYVGIKEGERLVTLYSAATLTVDKSGEITGATPQAPTVDQLEALLDQLQDTVDRVNGSMDTVQGIIEDGTQAVDDARQAIEDANSALATANEASAKATEAADSVAKAASEATETVKKAGDAADKANSAAQSANDAAGKATDAANSVNDAISSATETNDAIQAAEELRKAAEQGRVEAEGLRDSKESERQTNETARVEAEKLRASAEEARESASQTAVENAEAATKNANDAADRANASADAADAATQETVEATQRATESADAADKAAQRVEDAVASANEAEQNAISTNDDIRNEEAQRQANEELRKTAELERESSEEGRVTNENGRVEAEAQRVEEHKQHVAEQTQHNLDQAKNNADQAANNQAATGLQFQILEPEEYDPETLVPTLDGTSGKFYLAPYAEQEGSDLYAEWIWVDENGSFERVGNTAVTIEPITTEQIDSIVDEAAQLQNENVLTGTGLSYYDTKTKAREDAKEAAIKSWVTDEAKAHEAANADNLVDAIKKEIALLAHPIGSYYWSSDKTDPGTLFGGVWEAVEDRFIYAAKQADESGKEGGAATVALDVANMPSHTHTGPSHTHTVKAHAHGLNNHTHSTPNHVHHIGDHSHTISAHTHLEKGFHVCSEEASGYALWAANPVTGWNKGFDNRVMVENGNAIASNGGGVRLSTDSGGGGNTGMAGAGDLASGGGGTSGTPSVANTADSAAFETAANGTGNTGAAGGGTAHENMPPYITAYCWRRTE